MKKVVKNKKDETLYIVIPAYNEAENIEEIVTSWYKILNFADSGSTDKTNEILKRLSKKYDNLVILSDGLKQHGPKLIELYKYAIDKNADWVFQTDSDGQTNPNEFEKFWNLRHNYDAIIGKRTKRGDGKSRKFVEDVLCTILKVIFGVNLEDSNAPFRLMKTSLVKKYIDRFQPDYNLTNVMLCVFYKYYNENVHFEEISFESRKAGVNSINIKKIIKIGFASLKDFRNFKKDMKNNDKKI